MSRIAACFAHLRSENRKGLITFIMGGDPDAETFQSVLEALPAAGVDIIEVGIPFSDPMADGPTIQLAAQRALQSGATLKTVLRQIARFREVNDTAPLVLMGYYNSLYSYGVESFLDDAAKAGVDGLIMVDLPPEEAEELTAPAIARGIDLIRLIAPTTPEGRLPLVAGNASGFLYYISVAGVTGQKSATVSDLAGKIAAIRRHTGLPVAIGFGIKTPEQAYETAQHADAVVVGSALVDIIANRVTTEKNIQPAIDFVQGLAHAVRR